MHLDGMEETRKTLRIFMGNPLGKGVFVRRRRKYEKEMKMNVERNGCKEGGE
jgi:hypothetical protein